MAMWFQAVPPPMEAHGAAVDHLVGIERRRAVHLAAEAELGVLVGAATMPDLASRRDASTSWVLLPIEETMPIPVTTTRLMSLVRTRAQADRIAVTLAELLRRQLARRSASSRNSPTCRSVAR